ncbi:MAG: carboxypeptidase-like regulatory domain-containing protein [Rhodothermales bacterium]
MKHWLSVALVVLVGIWDTQARQSTIQGRVLDAETREPLPGVNVFLNQTLLGAATDAEGRYQIDQVPPGSYQVVASSIGFTARQETLEVQPGDNSYLVNIRLSAAVVDLGGVEVEAERSQSWRRDLKRFERLFIGEGPHARETTIENATVLNFASANGVFSAEAREPLRITNRGLGYRILFWLDDFRMDYNDGLLYTHGPFYFEEMTPRDDKEATRWRRNRARAYNGSLPHILASLVAQTTEAQGLTVRHDGRHDAPYSLQRPFLRSIDDRVWISDTEQPYLYRVAFDDYLHVTYQGNVSWLTLNRDEALVHESGYVYSSRADAGSVSVFGALAERRISQLLPRDYRWSP